MKIKEEWRDIVGYEGSYQISNHGRIKSLRRKICWLNSVTGGEICRLFREVLIQHCSHDRGYRVVYLRKQGLLKKKFFVHQLVGRAFLSNPDSKPIVNHKDLNKENNHVLNLEWASGSENTNHYYKSQWGCNVRIKTEAEVDMPF